MAINEEKLSDFHGRVFQDLAGTYSGVMATLGNRLGLYEAMVCAGPMTALELAQKSGCAERYVREWLNSQVASEYIDYHPSSQTYELLPEQAEVLANKNSRFFMPGAWDAPVSMWEDEDKSIHAFKTGEGVAWGEHSGRLFCGVAAFFRNAYMANLVDEWLPALDGMTERLKAGITVADIGCGHGHSTILMANAFPNSTFKGFDFHAESVETAKALANQAGVSDRVEFAVADAKSYEPEKYDLICFFDCLHDMGDPVGAAAYAKSCLADDGTIMLIEPFAHDRVEDNISPVGRVYYAASTTICCAHSLSEDVGLALGAQAGPKRLRQVMSEAGFTRCTVVHETPFNFILEVKK